MPATTSSRSRSARCGPPSPGPFAPQGAERRRTGRHLVRPHDHGDVRARAVRGLHLGLHAALVERPVGADARAAQLVRDGQRFVAADGVDDVRPRPRCVEAGQTPRRRRREGSARCRRRSRRHRSRRAAERLDQAVVAAASTDGVLRRVDGADGNSNRVWSCSSRAADQRGSISKAMPSTSSPCWTRSKRASASSGQELEHLGRLPRRLVLGAAGVEHPQRVEGQRLPALLGEVGAVVRQEVS